MILREQAMCGDFDSPNISTKKRLEKVFWCNSSALKLLDLLAVS